MERKAAAKRSAALAAATLAVVLAADAHGQESYGDMERRLYLKPRTSPMEKPARRVAFQDGDFGRGAGSAVSLDGEGRCVVSNVGIDTSAVDAYTGRLK